jgi:hypothetical protein
MSSATADARTQSKTWTRIFRTVQWLIGLSDTTLAIPHLPEAGLDVVSRQPGDPRWLKMRSILAAGVSGDDRMNLDRRAPRQPFLNTAQE